MEFVLPHVIYCGLFNYDLIVQYN